MVTAGPTRGRRRLDTVFDRLRAPEGWRGDGATLAEAFDPKNNVLTAMRLALAGLVAVVHALAVGYGDQPYVGEATLGDLAVDGFFVLSGFLVTASLLRTRSVTRYAWHRGLRIMPAFWVCLVLIAAVAAPIVAALSGRPAWSVWTAQQESALDFLVVNAALDMNQYGIAGLPANVPEPEVFDGSLWTLRWEALCYIVIAALGVLGVLRRRLAVVGIVAVTWVLLVVQVFTPVSVGPDPLLRFVLLFLLAALALLYASRVPIRWWLAAGSGVLVAISLLVLPDYRALAAPAFAYLMLYLMVRVPPPAALVSDYSYGLYVYHYPVQQVLVVAGLSTLGAPAFVVITVAVSLGLAALSWWLVERPALNLKNAAWVGRLPTMAIAGEREWTMRALLDSARTRLVPPRRRSGQTVSGASERAPEGAEV